MEVRSGLDPLELEGYACCKPPDMDAGDQTLISTLAVRALNC